MTKRFPLLKYFQPVSGQWSFSVIDLKAHGAQPLALERIFLAPQIAGSYHQDPDWDLCHLHARVAGPGNGWTFLPECFLRAHTEGQDQNKVIICYVTDSNGKTLKFRQQLGTKWFALDMDAYGMHNGMQGLPSSKYDYRNSHLVFDATIGCLVFTTPTGVQRFYKFSPSDCFLVGKEWGRLEKTRLRNGMILRYNYRSAIEEQILNGITSYDPTETHLYASIYFSREEERLVQANSKEHKLKKHDKKGDKKPYASTLMSLRKTVCESHTGAKAVWKEEVLGGPIELKEKSKHQHVRHSFNLSPVRLLRSIQSSQGGDSSFAYGSRFICSDIVTEEGKLRAEYALAGGNYRIHALLRENDAGEYQTLYRFSYSPAEAGKSGGSSSIQLSDGSSIVYQIGPRLLVDSVSWKDPSGKTRKEERYIWNAQQWCERKELYAEGALVRTTYYGYDERGNPIREEVKGDLRGEGCITSCHIRRTFSQDALALLLSEEQENGRIDRYSYLPGTDILQSHIVQDKERVCLRNFFSYNAQHQLIEKRVDDGSSLNQDALDGVREAHITVYKLRQSAPCLHLPERKEEYVLDQGVKRCTAVSCYEYDQEGNITSEEHYDGEGQLLETLLTTYNARGDVVSETNALGQTATYAYDNKGRKIEEMPFSGDRKTSWHWDGQGRCTSRVTTGSDGLEERSSYSYDLYDNLICEIGPREERLEHHYAPLSGQLLKKQKSSACTLSGSLRTAFEEYTYDGIGRMIATKNAKNVVTTIAYTAYGKPHTVTYSDGTKEHFFYTAEGELKHFIDREGLQTHYTRDFLDRIIAKNYFDKQGNPLAEEHFDYNSLHLLRKSDREGHVTEYFYDAEGRVIEERAAPRSTRWSYDTRGNVKEVIYLNAHHNEENTLHVQIDRDRLGRPVEIHSKDNHGTLLKWEGISYDDAGRTRTKELIRGGQRVKEVFSYDTQDRIVRYEDCNGVVTTTQYGETFHAAQGKTLRIETRRVTSPEGEVTETWFDPAGRAWVLSKWDQEGRRLLYKEKEYNGAGELLYERQWFDDQLALSPNTVQYSYTWDQRVASSIRGAGTNAYRITYYTYTPEGRLASRTTPSGRSVYYTYDALGFLKTLKASDFSVDYLFDYNSSGRLVEATDLLTGLALKRTHDRFGSLLSETFPLDKQVSYQYDARGRLLTFDVSGLGSAHYDYDSLFLRAVRRLSPDGNQIASHRYTSYDLDGSLEQELLPDDLSAITYRRDAKGRLLESQQPQETFLYEYDAQDRLLKKSESSLLEAKTSSYTYDGLSQLLTEEEGSESFTYNYDGHGSRTQKNSNISVLNTLDEELSSGDLTFTYDQEGNRIKKIDAVSGETWIYRYNALQQLIEASSAICRVHIAYDPLGRKSRRILEKRETPEELWQEADCLYFLYQGEEEIGAYRSTGEQESYRLIAYPEKILIPRTLYVEIGDKWYVPKVNRQGTITHLIDPDTSSISWNQPLTVFGEPLTSQNIHLVKSPWSYLSKRLDPELGLFDFGKRWYDPKQARWITLDPAGFIEGTHLYRYARNNPLLYTDPNGEFAMILASIGWNGITWLTGETILAATAAIAATYGTYKACEYIDKRAEREEAGRQEVERQMLAWQQERDRAAFDARGKENEPKKNYEHKATEPNDFRKDPDKWDEKRR